ncbi:MAG: DUF1176 domain-containing protein [Myxococcales bacterium]|nr:DUF1176 domain-containing protein [Myxococcales bacterium]
MKDLGDVVAESGDLSMLIDASMRTAPLEDERTNLVLAERGIAILESLAGIEPVSADEITAPIAAAIAGNIQELAVAWRLRRNDCESAFLRITRPRGASEAVNTLSRSTKAEAKRQIDDIAQQRSGRERPVTPGRPQVEITARKDRVVARICAEVLPKIPRVYTQGGQLVRVRQNAPVAHAITRPTLEAAVWEVADFIKRDHNGNTRQESPSGGVFQAVLDQGEWEGVPELRGIAMLPPLRPDGTVWLEPGYDPVSKRFVRPEATLAAVKPDPTPQDAAIAARALLQPFDQVCFLADADRDAFLALILSVVGRGAYNGPCPLFVVNGNLRGVGKTLVASCAGRISTGKVPVPRAWSSSEEEQRKALSTILLHGAADPVAFFDNVAVEIGGPTLDMVLTGSGYADRALGSNTERRVDQIDTVFVMTSNNARFRADTARRALTIRLRSMKARPEERAFEISDLRGHVAARQPDLYAAAITMLRAYIVAGRPPQKTKPFGSFEGWSALVRGTLLFSGRGDPLAARQGIQSHDEDESLLERLASFVQAWRGCHVSFTVGEVAQVAEAGPDGHHIVVDGWRRCDLWDLLADLGALTAVGRVNRRALGQRLRRFQDRPTLEGRKFEQEPRATRSKGSARWRLS